MHTERERGREEETDAITGRENTQGERNKKNTDTHKARKHKGTGAQACFYTPHVKGNHICLGHVCVSYGKREGRE